MAELFPSATASDSGLTPSESGFLELCRQYPEGLTDEQVSQHLPTLSIPQRAEVINSLARKNLIQFLKVGTSIVYQGVRANEVQKLHGLNPEERLVYTLIKQADNKGIWTRDIRNRSNLQQQQITKILKTLESKKIIKSVKSVESKNKKLFMLYEIEPSRQITGGAWYSEQEFDSEFIDMLSKQCFAYIVQRSIPKARDEIYPPSYEGFPKVSDITEHIARLGVCKITLHDEDILMIIDTLIYDGKVERLPSGAYRAVKAKLAPNGLTEVPCGMCPVFKFCTETGPISPSNCEYYDRWLDF